MKNKFQRFIESECERQWNEYQAKDGFGFWHEQADDTKAEFYNSMYEHLKDRYEKIMQE